MKKLFYSVFITSLLAVGVAHAEDTTVVSGNMMMSGAGTPTSTMMHITEDMMRGAPMMSSGTPPMMGTGTPMCHKFTRSLSLGIKGDDVKALQEMLHEKGFLAASSTGYFGKMTKDAVVKFQKDGGLNPSGFFGELSRKQHEKRCGQGGQADNKPGTDGNKPPMMNGEGHGPQGMGSGTPPMMGGKGDGHGAPMMGSGTPPMMPPPCPMTTGCGPKASGTPGMLPPPHMGSGTPPMMGTGTAGMLPPPPHQ